MIMAKSKELRNSQKALFVKLWKDEKKLQKYLKQPEYSFYNDKFIYWKFHET